MESLKNKKQKIAILSGHFMPEVGYQEVYLARSYAKSGNEVRVFTSNIVSPSSNKVLAKKYEAGFENDRKYDYSLIRLKSSFHFRSIVLCRGLHKHIESFQPDVLIIIGLAKLFPLSLLKKKLNCKYITVFGENKAYRFREGFLNMTKSMILDFGFNVLKRRYYKRSIDKSDLIVLNVPETEDFFKKFLKKDLLKKFDRKKFNFHLGFDNEEFYFDIETRKRIRKELAIPDNGVVIISVTKVTRNKKIEKVIDGIIDLINKGNDIYYLLIGLLGDNYETELRQKIADSGHSNRFYLYSFKNHNEVRNFYNASDIGIWTQAAISIQEAMGTGLKVLIPNQKSVSHLLRRDFCGWYFEEDKFEETLETAIKNINKNNNSENRFKIAGFNSSFLSYDFISERILNELDNSNENKKLN